MSLHYSLEDTINFKFTTRAFATNIPTTLLGTPVLSVYEDNSVTQITTGVSVTVDFDGVTGLNVATVVATTVNGYEVAKTYAIVVTTGTVDSVSEVGRVVGQFTLAAQPTIAGVPEVDTTYVAGSLASAASGTIDANVIQVSGDSTAADNLELMYDGTGYAAANSTIGTVTTLTGHTVQTGDNFPRLAAPAGASVSADIAAIKAETALIVADTNELQTDWTNGGRLDLIVDGILSDTNAILIDTAEIGVAGLGLNNLGGGGSIGTQVQTVVTFNALDEASLDARLGDVTIMSVSVGAIDGVTAAATSLASSVGAMVFGAAEAGTLTTTQMSTDLTETTVDHYKDRAVVWLDGALANQAKLITASSAAGVLTFEAATEAATATDNFMIV